MSTDLSEFLDIFFEECSEGLEVMESGLVELDAGDVDVEQINTIFRAAHSIKGGAATFDFTAVAEFTHVLEALLDQMRDGRREPTKEAVDLLLASVDGLRAMINATRANEPVDEERLATLKEQLESMLAGDSTAAAPPPAPAQPPQPSSRMREWHISFAPLPSLFATGNDPQHLLRALAELGALEVQAQADSLPALVDLDPESCRLSWQLTLHTEADEAAIREVFAWVDDEARLEIVASPELDADAPAPPDVTGDAEPPAAPESARAGDPPPAPPTAGDAAAQQDAACTSAAPPARPAAGKPAEPTAARREAKQPAESSSIRVGIEKVDELINLVGELVITQSMLSRFAEGVEPVQLDQLRDGLGQLSRNTRELQEMAMQIRMLPIGTSFNRFPRMIRDLSARLGKKVDLKISGASTELDKTVLEKIGDPLVHLVRNSMDHGLEMPQVRQAAGKPETGVLHLNAYHKGGSIIIEVMDDGAGLNGDKILEKARQRGIVGADAELSDEQIQNLIFQPGFSTVEQVSDVSGRGVGMDVVRRNIHDLGGSVVVDSVPGKGSIFTIRLPLTLAILDGQLVRVGDQTYIISLLSIIESLQVQTEKVNIIAGKGELYQLRDAFIPVVRLHEVFSIEADSTRLEDGLLVVVEAEGGRVGVFVDDLLGQQQVVIKSLEANYRQIDCLSGATILGDGTVALILDIPGLVQRALIGARAGARLQAA